MFDMHEWCKQLCNAITCNYTDFKNITGQDLEELYKWIDIKKDVAEAEYYETEKLKNLAIIEAMEKEDQEPQMYGYNNRRYSSGRYAPAGRGRYVGYRPYLTEDEDGIMDRYLNDPDFERNMRMGFDYHPPMSYPVPAGDASGRMVYGYGNPYPSGMSGTGGNNRIGTSYSRYNEMRRNYTENKDPEHKKRMNDAAAMVVNDMLDIMQDVWADLDDAEKAKHNQKILEAAKKY